MNNRTVLLTGLAAIVAILYITYFTDWFKPKKIQIMWRISAAGGRGATQGPNIVFYLNHPYPITSLKVVETDEALTNKYAHALWNVVANPAPVVTNTFNYGAAIPGMKPQIATALPEPLQSDISYSLLVEAGNLKGEKAFEIHGP
jgi:hypothetical protein